MSKTNKRRKGKSPNFVDSHYRPTWTTDADVKALIAKIDKAVKVSGIVKQTKTLSEERNRIAKEFKENEAQRNV